MQIHSAQVRFFILFFIITACTWTVGNDTVKIACSSNIHPTWMAAQDFLVRGGGAHSEHTVITTQLYEVGEWVIRRTPQIHISRMAAKFLHWANR